MIEQMERICGKMPVGLRLATTANGESITCFYQESEKHHSYVSLLATQWPKRWDANAKFRLGLTQDKTEEKNENRHKSRSRRDVGNQRSNGAENHA